MHAHRILGSFIVAATLLAPGLSQAAAAPQISVRVYARTHKDYHVWDGQEDQAYRLYLGDQHIKYRGYAKLSRKQQTGYWNYRHTQGEK